MTRLQEFLKALSEKDAKYFLDQLVEGEYYSITDIITDKQVKYERGN